MLSHFQFASPSLSLAYLKVFPYYLNTLYFLFYRWLHETISAWRQLPPPRRCRPMPRIFYIRSAVYAIRVRWRILTILIYQVRASYTQGGRTRRHIWRKFSRTCGLDTSWQMRITLLVTFLQKESSCHFRNRTQQSRFVAFSILFAQDIRFLTARKLGYRWERKVQHRVIHRCSYDCVLRRFLRSCYMQRYFSNGEFPNRSQQDISVSPRLSIILFVF